MNRRYVLAPGVAFLLAAVALVPLVPGAEAAEVVLKDGSRIPVARPYVTKGTMAVLTRPDGSVVSLPLSEIDVEKSAASAAAPPPAAKAPTPPPVPAKPMTPADAAKIKGARKATVVLTDDDVAPGTPSASGGKGEKGEGEVSIGAVQAVRSKTGYTVNGTVVNSGGGPVQGVSVSIELVGEENKTITTAFGRVAQPTLGPGESAAFDAEIPSAVEAKNFRYVPRWQVRIPVKPATDGQSAQAGTPTGDQPPSAGGAPGEGDGQKKAAKKPEPEKTPAPPPPGWAAPQANAPIEGSTAQQPGGTFFPRPADNQPKPPQ